MIKKDYSDLFELIQSFSKQEKRYLQRAIKTKKGSQIYFKLFKVIEQQDKYDKQAIIEKLDINTLQLNNLKQYLYKILLEGLIHQNNNNLIDVKLRSFISASDILQRKGLNHQAIKQLDKAKKIATKYEKLNELNIIYKSLLTLKGKMFYNKESNASLKNDFEQIELNHKKIVKVSSLNNLAHQLLFLMSKEGTIGRDSKSSLIVKLIEKNKALLNEGEKEGFQDLYYRYYILGAYNIYSNNQQKGGSYFDKILKHLDSNKYMIIAEPLMYFNLLLNQIIQLVSSSKYDEADKKLSIYYNRIVEFSKVLTEYEKAIFFTNFYESKIEVLNKLRLYEQSILLIEEINNHINQFERHISIERKLHIYYQIAISNFGKKNFNKTIDCLNLIDQHAYNTYREDLKSMVKLLSLITHFELQNFELLQYLIKSNRYYLEKRGKLYKEERLLIELLKKVSRNIIYGKSYLTLFEETHKKLTANINNLNESNFLKYFDCIGWLQQKMNH